MDPRQKFTHVIHRKALIAFGATAKQKKKQEKTHRLKINPDFFYVIMFFHLNWLQNDVNQIVFAEGGVRTTTWWQSIKAGFAFLFSLLEGIQFLLNLSPAAIWWKCLFDVVNMQKKNQFHLHFCDFWSIVNGMFFWKMIFCFNEKGAGYCYTLRILVLVGVFKIY